jgi:hypothetical protein
MSQMKQFLIDPGKMAGHFATCRKNHTQAHYPYDDGNSIHYSGSHSVII